MLTIEEQVVRGSIYDSSNFLSDSIILFWSTSVLTPALYWFSNRNLLPKTQNIINAVDLSKIQGFTVIRNTNMQLKEYLTKSTSDRKGLYLNSINTDWC